MLTQYKKYFFCLIGFLCLLLFISVKIQASPTIGKVTSIHEDVIEMDIGSEKGLKVGNTGRVFYTVTLSGEVKPIYLAKIRVINVSDKSSKAKVLEKTGEIKVGHLLEITKKEGEIEVKFEPFGAEVYLDGKEIGKTPLVFYGISTGKHLIRIVKLGYYPYEAEVEIKAPDRKSIEGSLAKEANEGYLFVRTELEEAQIYLNGKPFEIKLLKDGAILPAGEYRVKVEKNGYKTWETDVIVRTGEITEVKVRSRETQPEIMKEAQVQKCSLFINTHPAGARIYVNGRHYGTSPKYIELNAGKHSIVLIKDYYEPIERKLNVQDGQIVLPPIDQNLVPLKKE